MSESVETKRPWLKKERKPESQKDQSSESTETLPEVMKNKEHNRILQLLWLLKMQLITLEQGNSSRPKPISTFSAHKFKEGKTSSQK